MDSLFRSCKPSNFNGLFPKLRSYYSECLRQQCYLQAVLTSFANLGSNFWNVDSLPLTPYLKKRLSIIQKLENTSENNERFFYLRYFQ